MDKIIKIYKKYKGIINYLFFGVCTTLVNIVTYYIFSHILKASVIGSTIIAWILAVLFAYVTNRKWVFNSNAKVIKEVINELIAFFACRLLTGFLDIILMWIFVEKLLFNDILIKILSNLIVIILNYIFSKVLIFTNNKKKKNIMESLYIIAMFFIVAFFFTLNSPSHLWINDAPYTDSSVFKTVTLMMRNGYMPYLDTFDHKGPLLYLINYLGDIISINKGIWVIEMITLTITFYMFYKIANLKCKKGVSIFVSLIASTLLSNYYEGGNYCEIFALPFISFATYVFLDYVLNKRTNNYKVLLCGLCFGSVLMLRPNMIGVWFIFCFYIFIKNIIRKEFKELLIFIEFFLLGVLLIIAPILIWLYKNNALKAFYDVYIVFNGSYSANADRLTHISNIWYLFFDFINEKIILIAFITIIYSIIKEKINIIYLIYMMVTMLLICMSGNHYGHYMIVFVPAIIYPFSYLFAYIDKMDKNKICNFVIITYLLVSTVLPQNLSTIKNLMYIYANRDVDRASQNLIDISNMVIDNTDVNDKISVYGNLDYIYIRSNRLHATRYSYQFPIGQISMKIMDDYFMQLNEEKPTIIVIQDGFYNDRIDAFLKENNYSLIWNSTNDGDFKVFKIN